LKKKGKLNQSSKRQDYFLKMNSYSKSGPHPLFNAKKQKTSERTIDSKRTERNEAQLSFNENK
jgi:hypothetical protein